MILQQNLQFKKRDYNGIILLYDVGKEVYFNLNSTATFIWKLCSKPIDFENILKNILDAYSGDATDILCDVKKTIKIMIDSEVLCVIQDK